MLEVKTLSHLAKVFPDKIFGEEVSVLIGASNQELSYQVALSGEGEYEMLIMSTFKDLKFYKVGYVPSELPIYEGTEDDNYLTYKAGLFPDPLLPFDGKITLKKGENQSIWVTIPKGNVACAHKIVLSFAKDGKVEAQSEIEVGIELFELPEQDIYYTQWFHCDCIATVHGVEPLSDEHFALIEKYMRLASEHGMNMILTPVLTPPLDTEVGGERPTVQLVDITLENGKYSFDFTNLIRYANMARDCGIKYLEINHMFTQWGANNAPKVIATVDGEKKRIFGWETDATSDEYKEFLCALIPEVIKTLESIGFEKKDLFFHVSDEPTLDNIEQYRKVCAILSPLVEGCNQIDALSNAEFYSEGLVKTPVVGINKVDYFMREQIFDIWGYNCCAQSSVVSNRFFDMPSARNRIIGTQIFKYGLKGFLHWGYNFYYTRLSVRKELDPFKETDAGKAFPSGDSFSVYPYGDGAIPSIRQKVFSYALDDVRLLKLVESKVGTINTIRIINAAAEMDLSMTNYPKGEKYFERLYNGCFNMLWEHKLAEEKKKREQKEGEKAKKDKKDD